MSAITSDATPPSPVLARVAPVYGVVGISYLGYAMMATLFVPMTGKALKETAKPKAKPGDAAPKSDR